MGRHARGYPCLCPRPRPPRLSKLSNCNPNAVGRVCSHLQPSFPTGVGGANWRQSLQTSLWRYLQGYLAKAHRAGSNSTTCPEMPEASQSRNSCKPRLSKH